MSANRELFPGGTAFAPGSRLKVEAEKHLHLSRGLGREDLSTTSRAVRLHVGQIHILPVHRVEHMDSQQPGRLLRNPKAPRLGEIRSGQAWAAWDITPGRTECIGTGIAKARGVEPKIRRGFGREGCPSGLDSPIPPAGLALPVLPVFAIVELQNVAIDAGRCSPRCPVEGY